MCRRRQLRVSNGVRQLARTTSLEVNLLDNESKSLRSNVAVQRFRRYVSALHVSVEDVRRWWKGMQVHTVAIDVVSDLGQCITYCLIRVQ